MVTVLDCAAVASRQAYGADFEHVQPSNPCLGVKVGFAVCSFCPGSGTTRSKRPQHAYCVSMSVGECMSNKTASLVNV